MPLFIAMLPTYNEAHNIGSLIDALLALNENNQLPPESKIEVLVVDDNSPDGTHRLVRGRADADPRVHLQLRKRDKGRGLAGIAGFREGLRLGADYVIEMDADWSHDPKWIPSMARRVLEKPRADIVIGSRLCPGGREEGRGPARQWITRAANAYISFMLRLPVKDATSGFRVFSRAALETVPWNRMNARGPEIVQEVLLAVNSRGFKLAEVPIVFVQRRAGKSNFGPEVMLRSLFAMWRLRFFPGALTPASVEGIPLSLPAAVLRPISWLYWLGRHAHRALHLLHILPRRSLPVPVICVGNISMGGTGKTPFVIFLTRLLERQFRRHPTILSRGYGAQFKPVKPLIVADERNRLAKPETGGDEPCLIATELPGVPIVVFGDRFRAGQFALKVFSSDTLLLDDGFQHDALKRDVDIVLWDARDEPRKQYLAPRGRLREGIGALRRASAVVLTHAEYLPEAKRAKHVAHVREQLQARAPHVPIFEAHTRISGWRRLSGRHGEAEKEQSKELPWAGRRVILVAGLARPLGFAAIAEASGASVNERFFYPDHYYYIIDDVDHWRRGAERTGAEFVLTTEKDAIKLAGLPLAGLNMLAVRIIMEIDPLESFRDWLAEQLEFAAGAAKGH